MILFCCFVYITQAYSQIIWSIHEIYGHFTPDVVEYNILKQREDYIMALKPLADRIVIKVIEDTEQTSGGIFIPDSAKEKPQKGEVVAVGEG